MLGFITLCITITAIGQDQITRPLQCATLPVGYSPNADFTVNPEPGCLTKSNRPTGGARVAIQNIIDPTGQLIAGPGSLLGGDVMFLFNYKDSDGPIAFPVNASIPTHTYPDPGTYWIVVNGVVGTTSYITCKPHEVIATHELDIDYDFCDPLNLRIIIKDTPNNREQPKVRIIWGDGNSNIYPITTFPHTIDYQYSPSSPPASKPLVEGIYVRGTRDACTSDGVIIETTVATAPKIISLEGLAGGTDNRITIKGGSTNVEFNIEMKPKGGVWASTGKKIKAPATGTITETVTVPTAYGEYCFRLQKDGLCGSSTTSDPVCTIKATSQVLSPKKVKIDWTSESNPNVTRNRVHYKETPLNFQNYVTVAPSPNPTLDFDNMDCTQKYEFYIEASWITGTDRVQIISPPFEVNPNGGRVPNALVSYASVDADEVRIIMFTNGEVYSKYNIYKSEGNANNFKPLISIPDNSYSDKAVELSKQQYCYKVDYEDQCGNKSELSDPFCTVFLTSAQPNTLNWTPFAVSDPSNLRYDIKPVKYTIQMLDEINTVLATPGNTFDTMFDVKNFLDRQSNNDKVIFRVLAIQEATLNWQNTPAYFPLSSSSNTYTFIKPIMIYTPTAFTPNGEGPNESEVFKANGKLISEFNMTIYNRWGAPIFESNDITVGWDGTENGVPAPQGNYSYKIFGLGHAGQSFKKVGSVLLLR